MPATGTRANSIFAVAILGGSIALTGCGSGEATYSAGGRVTFTSGEPVTMGMVEFASVDPQKPVSASGPIQPDGTFRLGTHQPGDGAVLGEHRAVVAMPLNAPDGSDPPRIAPRFYDFEKSQLRFTVTKDTDQNFFEIVVDPYVPRGPR